MTRTHLKLASHWLNEAASQWGDHGCNDYRFPDWVSREDQEMILRQGALLGVFDESELPEKLAQLPYCPDFVVMFCLARMLQAE